MQCQVSTVFPGPQTYGGTTGRWRLRLRAKESPCGPTEALPKHPLSRPIFGLLDLTQRKPRSPSVRFVIRHMIARQTCKHGCVPRASGEFAKEMPCPHGLGEFLRSSFKTEYREMWAFALDFSKNKQNFSPLKTEW